MGSGIIVRESSSELVFRQLLQDENGDLVTSGTTSLRLYRIDQTDGSLDSYDFNDNTFKATALTTETASMTHRTGNNSTTNTGIWTYRLGTLTGFAEGDVILAQVVNSAAMPAVASTEFQFGGADGDVVLSSGAVESRLVSSATGSISAGTLSAGTIGASELASDAVSEIRDAILSDSTPFAGANIDAALSSLATAANLATVDTVVDSILANHPTNFADLSITATTGRVDVGTIEGAAATDQIRDAVVDDATRIDASALNAASVATIPALESSLTLVLSGVIGIKAVTDLIPDAGAMTSIAQAAALATVDSVVDSIETKVDTIDGLLDALIAGTSKVALRSDGLDSVVVETGINARQALALIGSAVAGVLAGAAGTSITIDAMDDDGTVRIAATVDANGNRTSITLTPPV